LTEIALYRVPFYKRCAVASSLREFIAQSAVILLS